MKKSIIITFIAAIFTGFLIKVDTTLCAVQPPRSLPKNISVDNEIKIVSETPYVQGISFGEIEACRISGKQNPLLTSGTGEHSDKIAPANQNQSSGIGSTLKTFVGYEYYPYSHLSDPETQHISGLNDLEIGVGAIKTGLSYPMYFRDGKTKFTNKFEYNQLRFDYHNWNFGPRIDEAHQLLYSGELEHNFSSNWGMLAIVSPSLASDFKNTISSDDIMLETAIVGIYNFSPRLAIGIGLGYNPRLGQPNLGPVLGILWNNGSNMKVEAILPNSFSVAYRPNPVVDFGLSVSLEGSQYHGDPDKFEVDQPYLRYSVAKAGPNIQFHVSKYLHLNIEMGGTFHRRFEFYDGSNKLNSYDLEQNYYIQTQVKLGI